MRVVELDSPNYSKMQLEEAQEGALYHQLGKEVLIQQVELLQKGFDK